MRIFVAGGTGVVGRPLVRALVSHGHQVTASTHRADSMPVVADLGAQPVVMNGLDDDAVRRAVLDSAPEVIINQVTSLAAPAHDYRSWIALTNRLRREGTAILMSAARDAGARRVIAQSASFMTEPVGAGPTDESSPLYLDGPEPLRSHARANHAAEEQVTGMPGIEGVVLRYGFLYGAGTAIGPGGDIATAVQAGEMPIAGDGAGRYPFLHVDDAVSATVQAVSRGAAGIYNVVDDEPAAQADWLPYLAELLGAPAPRRLPEEQIEERFGVQAVYYGNQLRAAGNARAKAQLALTLAYPSWRLGFKEVFAQNT
ncbi:NAD(P)-dependent oxidoreductase [Actinoplanes sp. NBC_00393]|uniref:NAD-dependent epimerase/dehydratase family protein n=1 Tax=Actinoplanes sp. NBC_00393 TaxID=2975953 RepID=UPI002E1A3E39